MKEPKVCLIEGCVREVVTRGLCNLCYQTARKYVLRGGTSWEQLVKEGFALKAALRGPGAFAIARAKYVTKTQESSEVAPVVQPEPNSQTDIPWVSQLRV